MVTKAKTNLFIPRIYKEENKVEEVLNYTSNYKLFFRNFLKNKFAITGLVIFIIFVATAFLAPIWAADPLFVDSANSHLMPSTKNWFGTDWLGRDIWSRVWYGLRYSLILSITVTFINVTTGTVFGLLQAYYSKFDQYSNLAIKVLYALPSVLLLIIFAISLNPSFSVLVLSLTVTGWVIPSQQVRVQALRVKDSDYISASVLLGSKRNKVLLNIMTTLIPIIVVQFSIIMPQVILAESFLGFLGLSVPDIPTMGNVINDGRNFIITNPLEVVIPTLVMITTVAGTQITGFGIEDAFRSLN